MNALAGLMNPAAIGQSFQMGMEQGRARRGEMETRNALSMLTKDPADQVAMQSLAFYNPQAAFTMQDRLAKAAKAKREAETQELAGLAAKGDNRALAALWGVDYETAMKLDDRQAEKATEGFKFIADAAFAIDSLPPGQQAAAFDAYINQGVQLGFDGLAQYRGQYNPQMLQGLVAKAGQMKPFMERRDPRFMAIPEGGTLVNTRDAAAVQQFGGQAPAQGGQQAGNPTGGEVMRFTDFVSNAEALGPQGAVNLLKRTGIAVQITGDAEYNRLPSGTLFVGPDGQNRVKP